MKELFPVSVPALIALCAALLAVWITLREERKKAREEREFAAKHKALLSAAEAVTRFVHYYITLPDREFPKDGTVPDELAEMGVALTRLHFYCSLESIKCSLAMAQVLSTSHNKVLMAKISSMFITGDINDIDVRVLGLEAANNHLQQEILALLSSDSSNPLLVAHRHQLASNFHRISELIARKAELGVSKYNALEACRDVIKEDLKEVNGALRDVLLMARRELSFPIDESAYATLISQSTDMALASLEKLFDEIRAQIRQKMERRAGRTLPVS